MTYQQKMLTNIPKGYVAYNGHVFTQAEADSYNAYNRDIKKHYELKNTNALNYWLNSRNLWFKYIIGEIKDEEYDRDVLLATQRSKSLI